MEWTELAGPSNDQIRKAAVSAHVLLIDNGVSFPVAASTGTAWMPDRTLGVDMGSGSSGATSALRDCLDHRCLANLGRSIDDLLRLIHQPPERSWQPGQEDIHALDIGTEVASHQTK